MIFRTVHATMARETGIFENPTPQRELQKIDTAVGDAYINPICNDGVLIRHLFPTAPTELSDRYVIFRNGSLRQFRCARDIFPDL